MAQLEPVFCKWLSDRMWFKGLHLFADDTNENNLKRIAFQMSRKNEITIRKLKYKMTPVFLLYTEKNTSIIPTMYFYETIDPIEKEGLMFSDLISQIKNIIPFSL